MSGKSQKKRRKRTQESGGISKVFADVTASHLADKRPGEVVMGLSVPQDGAGKLFIFSITCLPRDYVSDLDGFAAALAEPNSAENLEVVADHFEKFARYLRGRSQSN